MTINNEPQSLSIEPSATSSETGPRVTAFVKQRSHRAEVIGGVVGGLVAFVIITIAVSVLFQRIRKSRRDPSKSEEDPKSYLDLNKQSPGFFPREFTGPWTETFIKPRSSPYLI